MINTESLAESITGRLHINILMTRTTEIRDGRIFILIGKSRGNPLRLFVCHLKVIIGSLIRPVIMNYHIWHLANLCIMV